MRPVRPRRYRLLPVIAAIVVSMSAAASASGASGSTDVRLSNDFVGGGYVSTYTMATGKSYTDAALKECSQSRGRQNEPAVAIDPRNPNVMVGSSNDYCAVYDAGVDDDGAPIPSGPIWLGYYRSTDGGSTFASSLVPGYPGDTSPYASRAKIRTASSGDPVLAWDTQGRLFMGSESSDDPAGTKKTYGDTWVATFQNPHGTTGPTTMDGTEFVRSLVVGKGSAAPNLLGKFNDKTAIEADRTTSACRDNVYFAWSSFYGNGGKSQINISRSTDHGATWNQGAKLTPSLNSVQGAEITITGNGDVYVTWGTELPKSDQLSVSYAKSTDCGATFSAAKQIVSFTPFGAQDVYTDGSGARDCGDLTNACESGYQFFRHDPNPRAATDQNDPTSHSVYVTYESIVPGSAIATHTTFGSAGHGMGGQGAIYAVSLNGATGAVTLPTRIAPTATGHQLFPDLTVEGDHLRFIWWDSRNDPSYSVLRPIGNYADGSVVPSLDVYTATTSKALAPASAVRLTDVKSNGNFDQFGGRTVPFAGDYLWIDSQGAKTYAVWTDWRDTVPGNDQRTPGNNGSEVLQCRTDLGGGVFTGDTCPRDGGLDQNIYGSLTP